MPSLFLLAALGTGCAFHDRGLVLDPVGPASFTSEPDHSEGTLVVYSALDQGPHFNGVPYHHYYSDYKVLSDDGALLKKVHNDSDSVTEGPVPVKLGPGRYRVFARANGHGWVTVPVIIATHQITTVHLEGGAFNRGVGEGRRPQSQIVGHDVRSVSCVASRPALVNPRPGYNFSPYGKSTTRKYRSGTSANGS